MSGPVSFSKAQEIAAKLQAKGLNVPRVGIFAVGEDGHIKLTIAGSPEQWDALLAEPPQAAILAKANEEITRLNKALTSYADHSNWLFLETDTRVRFCEWAGDGNGPDIARAVLHQEPPKGEKQK